MPSLRLAGSPNVCAQLPFLAERSLGRASQPPRYTKARQSKPSAAARAPTSTPHVCAFACTNLRSQVAAKTRAKLTEAGRVEAGGELRLDAVDVQWILWQLHLDETHSLAALDPRGLHDLATRLVEVHSM